MFRRTARQRCCQKQSRIDIQSDRDKDGQTEIYTDRQIYSQTRVQTDTHMADKHRDIPNDNAQAERQTVR